MNDKERGERNFLRLSSNIRASITGLLDEIL